MILVRWENDVELGYRQLPHVYLFFSFFVIIEWKRRRRLTFLTKSGLYA